VHARLREAGFSAAPRKEAVAEPGEVLSVSSYLSFRERYATAFAQNPHSLDFANPPGVCAAVITAVAHSFAPEALAFVAGIAALPRCDRLLRESS
jgi:hypothetical protein